MRAGRARRRWASCGGSGWLQKFHSPAFLPVSQSGRAKFRPARPLWSAPREVSTEWSSRLLYMSAVSSSSARKTPVQASPSCSCLHRAHAIDDPRTASRLTVGSTTGTQVASVLSERRKSTLGSRQPHWCRAALLPPPSSFSRHRIAPTRISRYWYYVPPTPLGNIAMLCDAKGRGYVWGAGSGDGSFGGFID